MERRSGQRGEIKRPRLTVDLAPELVSQIREIGEGNDNRQFVLESIVVFKNISSLTKRKWSFSLTDEQGKVRLTLPTSTLRMLFSSNPSLFKALLEIDPDRPEQSQS